ncbi:restriction endonuclease subunit S [candidate division WOR-3 bacterium]|nr:restriction endonuclease subunit S [candidate division WOR-3 bacterium]
MNKIFEQTKTRKIPKDWEVAKLGDKNIVDLIMGQSPPSSTYNKKAEGLPFLQGKAEFGKIYPSPLIYCSRPLKIAEKNDLLLSVRAPVGDVNITLYKSCIGRGLTAIRPKSNRLHYLYLFYYLVFNKRIFQFLAAGSTFKAIRKNEIENYSIPLPPLPEQHRIAEILSTADKAIEKVHKAIEKTERLKKGLMQELLTKGIGHKEFKDTEIGRIPKKWEVVRLSKTNIEVIDGDRGINYPKQSDFSNKGYCLFLNAKNVTQDGFKFAEIQLISKEKDSKMGKGKLKRYDIVLTTRGTIGNVGYYDSSVPYEHIRINSGMVILRNKNNNAEYKFFYLLFRIPVIKAQIKRIAYGTAQPQLNVGIIKNLKIPLPPHFEQQKIAGILDSVDNRIELLREKTQKLEKVKRGLMNDLLAGKKRVKV